MQPSHISIIYTAFKNDRLLLKKKSYETSFFEPLLIIKIPSNFHKEFCIFFFMLQDLNLHQNIERKDAKSLKRREKKLKVVIWKEYCTWTL